VLSRFFGHSEKTARMLEEQAADLSNKHRVEIRMPLRPAGITWTIRAGREVLDTARTGEVLRVLVDGGHQRVIAYPQRDNDSRGVLLFSGNVTRDVSLNDSQNSVRVQ
jgi:hypothetical protein